MRPLIQAAILSLVCIHYVVSLNKVVRPGSLIDLNVNGTLIDPNVADAGPARPSFAWDDEALILHGFNIGAEYRF